MITSDSTDPLAQLQQRLDAVLLRLQHIEEAAERILDMDGTETDRRAAYRELREALDAG